MRQDINRRLKRLEDVHASQQPPEPDDEAVRVWKFLLAKRRMNEERGWYSQSPPPTLGRGANSWLARGRSARIRRTKGRDLQLRSPTHPFRRHQPYPACPVVAWRASPRPRRARIHHVLAARSLAAGCPLVHSGGVSGARGCGSSELAEAGFYEASATSGKPSPLATRIR